MNLSIRPANAADIPHFEAILNTIELFPAEMTEEMMSDYLHNADSEDIWFTATADDTPVSLGYCTPEQLTEGTFNLLAIGVKADRQGKGVGAQMMHYLETELHRKGHRILIVETSGTEDFALTRRFYEQLGYDKEAVIRDFWKEGDDKVIYRKKLN